MRMFSIHRLTGYGSSVPVAEIGVEEDKIMIWPKGEDGIPETEYFAFNVALEMSGIMQGVILTEARNIAETWVKARSKAQGFVDSLSQEKCKCKGEEMFYEEKCLSCKAKEILK